MHSAASCLARTSNTSSCSHDRSRSSTAQRIVHGARLRNSSSRSTLRFQRGGSCTRVGPRCSPRRSTRSRWLGSHEAASPSFMRCEPNAPSLTAKRNPACGRRRPALDRRRRWEPVEGRVELDGVEQLLVVLEPAPLRDVGRVHDAAPVLVRPARAADAERPGRGRPPRRAVRRSSTIADRISAPRLVGAQDRRWVIRDPEWTAVEVESDPLGWWRWRRCSPREIGRPSRRGHDRRARTARIGFDPRMARLDLGAFGFLCSRRLPRLVLEVLHGIGDIDVGAIDAGLLEALPKHTPGRPDEGAAPWRSSWSPGCSPTSISAARSTAFTEHRLRRRLPELASPTTTGSLCQGR